MPIIPFYHDDRDEELFHLMTYMHGVSEVEDIRDYNREAFGLLKLQAEVSGVNSDQKRSEDARNRQNRKNGGVMIATDSEDDGNVRSGVSS